MKFKVILEPKAFFLVVFETVLYNMKKVVSLTGKCVYFSAFKCLGLYSVRAAYIL